MIYSIILFSILLSFNLCTCIYGGEIIPPRNLTITGIGSTRYRIVEYYKTHNKIPDTLTQLPLLPDRNCSIKDGWDREIGYNHNEKNVITIWSLGKDGLPGGDNEDTDIIESFKLYEGMSGNDENGKTLREEGEITKPDWSKLDFFSLLEDERIINKFEIELFKKTKISVTDESQLKYLKEYLTMPLRIASKKYNSGWHDSPIGKITVETNQDIFIVGINPSGFSLESEHTDIQNVFFSYPLAQFINEIYHKETKKYIEPSIIEGLSGENRLKSDKRLWDKWKAKDGLGEHH
jgi:hypothetical protein